jgi:RNA polymerase sigma factor (sigma-70 family)
MIRELYPALRRYAAVVHPFDMDPDDLLQEAICRVLRRGALSEIPYPMAYLRRAMTNLASNHNRSQGRRRTALRRLRPDEATMPHYPSDVEYLMDLKPDARAILFMRAIEGRPFAEIAEVLGITDTAARAIDSRARRSLRDTLLEERHETA